MAEKSKKMARVEKSHLSCPYCDKEIAEAAFPYCEACKVTLLRCPKCFTVVERKATKCPQCGTLLRNSTTAQGGTDK
jgi:hypothetical protein